MGRPFTFTIICMTTDYDLENNHDKSNRRWAIKIIMATTDKVKTMPYHKNLNDNGQNMTRYQRLMYYNCNYDKMSYLSRYNYEQQTISKLSGWQCTITVIRKTKDIRRFTISQIQTTTYNIRCILAIIQITQTIRHHSNPDMNGQQPMRYYNNPNATTNALWQ